MRVSILGMGSMGHAVAARLVGAGHQVTVWNRSAGKADDLVDAGAREATTTADAVEDVDVILTSLSDDAAVRAVLLPDGKPLDVGADQIVVDCTTVSPDTTRAIASAYPAFVAAPILGAPAAVASGQAVYALGGSGGLIERLDPLWSSLTTTTRIVGDDPATATTVKLLSNALLLTGIVALSEVVAAAQGAGLDDELVVQLLSHSPLVAPGLHNRIDDMVHGDHDGWFAMPLGAKDLDLFVGLAAAGGVDAHLVATARDRYRQAAEAGWQDADVAGVVELARGRTPDE